VTLVVELEGVVVELEVVLVELDDELEYPDPPDALEEPEEPVVEMTGVPVGRDPLEEGMVTTTVPLPVLTTGVPGLPDGEPPDPEPPEPEPPEPVDTGVLGVAETGVGVVTTGTVPVVVPPPEPLAPEPEVPEPPLPEPVLVGVEPRVGALPATGWEMVAEVECCAERWLAVPWLASASRVLRLLAIKAGRPAAPAWGLTTLMAATP
jgi:hypothetical protein